GARRIGVSEGHAEENTGTRSAPMRPVVAAVVATRNRRMPRSESRECPTNHDAMVLVCERDRVVPTGQIPRTLEAPGGAAVSSMKNGTSAYSVHHNPTAVHV